MSDELSAEAEEYERHYTLNKNAIEVAALETKVRHFEEERRLWQAVALAASMLKGGIEGLHEEEVDLECSDGFLALVSSLDAARAAGLTWEGEK